MSAGQQHRQHSQREDARSFFASMFSEIDSAGSLFKAPDHAAAERTEKDVPLDRKTLESFLSSCALTVQHYLCAAFGYTLSRFSGTDVVQFCFSKESVDNTSCMETAETAETTESDDSAAASTCLLPLLLDCSDMDVSAYLQRSRDVLCALSSHDCLPLEDLLQDFPISTEVVFRYVSTDEDDATCGGKSARKTVAQDAHGNLSVTVFHNGNDGFRIQLASAADYSATWCNCFVESYVRVLQEMLVNKRLADIDYASVSDRTAIEQLNLTDVEFRHSDILEAFAHSIKNHPHNTLVRFRNNVYTYEQSARMAQTIARALDGAGIASGTHIAILVPRSEWYVLAALGVLTHGSAYVPIDDIYPDERIAFMLADTNAQAILVTKQTKQQAIRVLASLAQDIELVQLDALDVTRTGLLGYSYRPANPKDNAFIVYTSGTTGKPKAIQLTRQGLLNCAEWYVANTGLAEEDVYALYSAFTFDMHMVGFYPSIICGSMLDIVPPEIRLDPEALNEHFREIGATHTYLPTQIGRVYVERKYESTLKFLLVIGEKLGEFTAPDSIGMCESYGPTETLTFTTAIPVNDRQYANCIGRPISNTKLYILDTNRRLVPKGAVGELYIATKQISNGYLNRDEENAAAFLPNPFDGETPGYETMYKTGDMAVLLPDNTIGFMGRRDSQVKIRGNRVELAEVESAIRELNTIEDVTVSTVEHNKNLELVAYIVVAGSTLSHKEVEQQIVAHIGASKPAYMIPSYIEVLDRIPFNVNGKVDKRALPAPAKLATGDEVVNPNSFLEANVLRVVCECLDIGEGNVGITTDLTRCGLDSLSAITLSVACRQRCNVECSAFNILTHPTIEGFLQHRSTTGYQPIHVLHGSPDDGRTLMFVHTRNDASVTYLKLVQAFSDGMSFACVDNYNLHHLDDRIRGYKHMARRYVDYVRAFQNEGPYYLGGWSLGGCIAYEMAAILRAKGQQVAKVYLLDSEHFKNSLSPQEKQEYARLYVKNFFRSKWPKEITKSFSSQLLDGYKQEYYGQMLDALNYEPSRYDGKVVFFKSTIRTLEQEDTIELNAAEAETLQTLQTKIGENFDKQAHGFEDFASELQVVEVPFHHDNLMTDTAPARMIAQAIERDMRKQNDQQVR